MTAQNLCCDPLFTNFPSHKTAARTVPHFTRSRTCPHFPLSTPSSVTQLVQCVARVLFGFPSTSPPHNSSPLFGYNRRVLLYDYEICIHNIIPRNKNRVLWQPAQPSGCALSDAAIVMMMMKMMPGFEVWVCVCVDAPTMGDERNSACHPSTPFRVRYDDDQRPSRVPEVAHAPCSTTKNRIQNTRAQCLLSDDWLPYAWLFLLKCAAALSLLSSLIPV